MKIYVVMGQSQITNFVMQVFKNKPDAEKFIADEKEKGGADKAPYIEEHELN